MPLSGSIENTFRRRVDALPAHTRALLLVAAADPVGEPVLVWRAAGRLGIGAEVATPAAEAGLLEFGTRMPFRHPLVRSAAYRSASLQSRRDVHRALAEVTDPGVDPDRRARHRARKQRPAPTRTSPPSSSARPAARRHAGAWPRRPRSLERSVMLTPEPARRAPRGLRPARAKRDAGALDAALGLLVAVEAGPLEALSAAEVDHLRGQIAPVRRP